MLHILKYKLFVIFFITIVLCLKTKEAAAQYSKNDTILTTAIVYNGDTIEAKMMADIILYSRCSAKQKAAYEQWSLLRNAVYVTYPYARNAAYIINDVNAHLANVTSESARKAYIKLREKDIKKNFEAPITNLTVYQGKILMKLINRATGNNCYNLIKEYKGGLTARMYQTVAFFFDSDLKQPYDPNGDDAAMEKIVIEVARMYGDKS
jgi:uncharacterized protein DUF4294